MIKDLSLKDFNDFLKRIIISNSVINSGIHQESHVQEVKNGGYADYTHMTFNDFTTDNFLVKYDDFVTGITNEIDFNREAGAKIDLENYLISVKEIIVGYINNFEYNNSTASLDFKNIEASEDIKDFKLAKSYKDEIVSFKRKLLDRLFEFQGMLLQIPEYKLIANRNQKSTSGNQKIEWKEKLNKLVSFYLRQIDGGLIETSRENLKTFLLNNYTWKGRPLSENTIATYLDPNRKYEDLPKEDNQLDPKDYLQEK